MKYKIIGLILNLLPVGAVKSMSEINTSDNFDEPKFYHYIKFSVAFDEFGYTLEKNKNYQISYLIEVGFRFRNWMDYFGIIPDLMSNRFDYCRLNQSKGIHSNLEQKRTLGLKEKFFISYGVDYGLYWTKSGEMLEHYTYDSDPNRIYFIEKLNVFRTGLNFSIGKFLDNKTSIKLILGPRIQYYNLHYYLKRGLYMANDSIGEHKKETGFTIMPNLRVILSICLNNF